MAICLLPVMAAKTGAHQWADHSVLSQGAWIKIALDNEEDGIYQISYDQLRNWGFKHPQHVGVYGFGGHTLSESFAEGHIDDLPELRVWHDEARQRILFYAQGTIWWSYKDETYRFVQRQHPYAMKAFYFLHEKTAEEGVPLPLDTIASNAETPSAVVDSYDERWLHEEERVNIGASGRELYGESFLTTSAQSFDMDPWRTHPDRRMPLGGSMLLTVNFVAKSSAASSFSVRLGETTLGTQNISASTSSYAFAAEATFNQELKEVGGFTNIPIRITYKPGAASASVARLNYIRLQALCPLQASDKEGYFLFRNRKADRQLLQYHISGIGQGMMVWDVTDPVHPSIQLLEQGDETSQFVPQEKGIREYAVVNPASSSFPSVSQVGKVRNQDLHACEGVNFVIVAPSGLVGQAKRLAEYRESHDSLTTLVVTPEQIYNEYSSGVPDATAIRLFLKQMYDRNKDDENDNDDDNENGNGDDNKRLKQELRYLLLFGDAYYNNREACASNFYLPIWESENSLVETSSTCCDDYYGFLDDDEGGRQDANDRYTISQDRLDIGVGRLPVHSTAEAEAVLNKILRYSDNRYQGIWKNRLCFLSDDDKMESSGTDSPNLHMIHNDQLIASMQQAGHQEFIYQKIYLPAYQQATTSSGTDYPDARKQFMSSLQQGVLLVNYAGHGSVNAITHENIMTSAIASDLRMQNLPVWITATCDVSRFDNDAQSLGEALLLNPNGGASALFSTVRVVYAQQNLNLNKAIINHLFDRNSDGTRFRLGDILKAAKVALGSDYNKLNFCLLGDPSMTIAYPEHQLVVDSERQTEQGVTIRGRVLQVGTQQTDTTFNGLIYPTVFDSEESVVADKGRHQDPVYTFMTRNRKVFSGRDVIRQGEFEFSFMVPQDLSAEGAEGLINLYACSDEGAEGQGFYDDITLRTTDMAEADTVGPDILHLFLDSPSFQSGDIVGPTPFFYAEARDASGFNATGNSIGHNIVLNISCISNPLIATTQHVLNDYFTTFTGDASHGNVKYAIPSLPDGDYEATFRIWDTQNNFSQRTFRFRVMAQRPPEIALVQAYPSPARQGEAVTFRVLHNRPESADRLRLQVYTQTGVKVLDTTISSSACEVAYQQEGAQAITEISHALNADETSQLMGCSSFSWNASVAPGLYVYKVYLSSGSSEVTTQSKPLIIQ